MSWFLVALIGCSTPQVDIADAATTEGLYQRTIELRGGTIRAEYLGAWGRDCTADGRIPSKGATPCKDLQFYVAPIVGEGWTPEAPVTAWATCPSKIHDRAACVAVLQSAPSDLGARVLSTTEHDSGWTKAIADAAEAHGVRAAESAPVLLVEGG